MNFAKKLSFSLLALAATTFTANAQDARAKFTLTHEVRWQKTMLPAGTYTISVESGTMPRAVIASETGKREAIITVPTFAEYSSSCKSSSVTLVRNGESWDVSSVCFDESGLALYFNVAPSGTTMARLSPQGSATGSH